MGWWQWTKIEKIVIAKIQSQVDVNHIFQFSRIYKEFVSKDRTIFENFYFQVLDCLCERIQCMVLKMWIDRTYFLLHDNALSRTAIKVVHFLARKGKTVLSILARSESIALSPSSQIEIGAEGVMN